MAIEIAVFWHKHFLFLTAIFDWLSCWKTQMYFPFVFPSTQCIILWEQLYNESCWVDSCLFQSTPHPLNAGERQLFEVPPAHGPIAASWCTIILEFNSNWKDLAIDPTAILCVCQLNFPLCITFPEFKWMLGWWLEDNAGKLFYESIMLGLPIHSSKKSLLISVLLAGLIII